MPEPIIDVHLHALAADAQGPPPLAFDLPVQEWPVLDPAESYVDLFLQSQREPRGDRAVWSSMTDEELRDQTLEVMERRNIVGVVSGPEDRVVEDLLALAPNRLIPGRYMAIGRDEDFTPDDVRRLHAAGQLQVLGDSASLD